MTITLYRNSSDINVVDKSISSLLTLTGTLRSESSIISPTILVEDNSNTVVSSNYLYIPEWNRYYYITDIESIRTGLWAISAKVDVLMSFRQGIRGCSAIIARQENEYNLYLDDDKFLVNANRKVVARQFPNAPATGFGSFMLIMSGLTLNESS